MAQPGFDAAMDGSRMLALVTTGSLSGDVRMLKEVLTTAAREAIHGPDWTILDAEDPMATIGYLAAFVATLNMQLKAQGFRPPLVQYEDDPLGFLEENAAFFVSIEGQVADPPVTRH